MTDEIAEKRMRNSILSGGIGALLYVVSRGLQFLDNPPGFANTLGLVGFILAVVGLRSALRWRGSPALNRLGIIIPIYLGVLVVAFIIILFAVADRGLGSMSDLSALVREHQGLIIVGGLLFIGFLVLMILLGLVLLEFGRNRGEPLWIAAGILIVVAQLVLLAVIAMSLLTLMGSNPEQLGETLWLVNLGLIADIAAWIVAAICMFKTKDMPRAA